MKPCDYYTVLRAIENCEEREKRICQNYIDLHPGDRERIEHNRDMFLFATYIVRMEFESMLKGATNA